MNLLGIDVGTTSVKTAVYDEGLTPLLSLTADYTLSTHGAFVEFPADG